MYRIRYSSRQWYLHVRSDDRGIGVSSYFDIESDIDRREGSRSTTDSQFSPASRSFFVAVARIRERRLINASMDPRTSFFNISAREFKCTTKSKSCRRKGKVVCMVVQSSICICRHDEIQKDTGKEREKEHACSNGLPLCCALGVSSIAPRPSRKRKRPRRLADTYNPDSLQ